MKTHQATKNSARRPLWAGRAGWVIALSAATILSGCGSDSNNQATSNGTISCATGSVDGAGSTFVTPIAQQWVKDYQAACPGTTINYKGVGSGAGITQFTQGAVQFAASDVQLKDSEQQAANAKYGVVLTMPWAAGAVAVEYNVSGVDSLQLSPATLGGIFAGTIKTWNDAAIKADNPGVTLPSVPVQVMHRSDGSGTTAVFTEYLTATASDVWKAGAGKEVTWPTGQGLKGSDGVTAAIKQTDGAIGYAELSFAKSTSLKTAKIKNASGAFVGPDSADGVTAALAEAGIDDTLKVTPNYKPQSANAYPISSFTYVIAAKGVDEKAKLIQSFVEYAAGSGQNAAAGLSYAPLPKAVADKVKEKAATLTVAS